jgi:hypothetical protein
MHSMISGCLAGVVALGLAVSHADAAKKKRTYVPVGRAAIYPPRDRTVIRVNGMTRIVVNRRSYLDPGTAVAPNEGSERDYAFPTGGDPGHPNWFYGRDMRGAGHWPLPGPFDP